MNEAVIEKAKELARALASSGEYLSMRQAENDAAKDERLTAAFGRYSELQEQLKEASLRESPDFAAIGALSREMETVQEEIQNAPAALKMREAKARFQELMAAVNQELSRTLDPNFGKTASGCTGDCASCGGCGN